MTTVSPAAVPAPGGRRPLRLSHLSDELLARSAARGSDKAFTVLYERYYQPLYRYCRSIVRNEADAQDALQSTFASALTALRRDGRNAPLRPWLYRIAHNESISLLRRRNRDALHEGIVDSVAVGVSAEEEAAGRARWQGLVADLAELPERQRGALLLRELAGLSHEDIATALGLSVGGAKQAIFEARQGLDELEQGRIMTCEEVRERISEGDRRVLRGRRVRSHLRECAACDLFSQAIPARQAELRALAPALPPTVAAAVFSQVIRAGSPHAGASAGAGSVATAGVIGKAAGTAMVWKAVVGAAVVATAVAGVTVTRVLHHGAEPAVPVPQVHGPGVNPAVGKASGSSSASDATAVARPASGHGALTGAHHRTSRHRTGAGARSGGSTTSAGQPGRHAGAGNAVSRHSGTNGSALVHSNAVARSHSHSGGAQSVSHGRAAGQSRRTRQPTARHRTQPAAHRYTGKSSLRSSPSRPVVGTGVGVKLPKPSDLSSTTNAVAGPVKANAASGATGH